MGALHVVVRSGAPVLLALPCYAAFLGANRPHRLDGLGRRISDFSLIFPFDAVDGTKYHRRVIRSRQHQGILPFEVFLPVCLISCGFGFGDIAILSFCSAEHLLAKCRQLRYIPKFNFPNRVLR